MAGDEEQRADVEPEGAGEEEEVDKFVPGKKVSLKEQLELDKEDESLRKWKEQLLGSLALEEGAAGKEPEIEFKSMKLLVEGRDDVDLALPQNAKQGPGAGEAPPHFVLKEKSLWKLKFEFEVKNELVLGLSYWRRVHRMGVQVDKTSIMLGTYGPQKELYTYETREEETPSGILARGKYSAKTGFSDDDGKTYLEMDYTFEIKKDW